MANGHYLEVDRLAYIIAAIQILGVSDQPTGTLNRWVAELESSEELTPEQIDHIPIKYAERKKWAAVFEQHPEFFKTYKSKGEQHVLLRWRYAQFINSMPRKDTEPKKDADSSSNNSEDSTNADERTNDVISPLNPDQIQVLINTAIELHAKEEAVGRAPDRFTPILMTAIGAALGTVVGGTMVVLLGWIQIAHIIRIFD